MSSVISCQNLQQQCQKFIMPYKINNFFFNSFLALITISYSQPSICSPGCLACKYTTKTCTACDDGFELNIIGTCFKANGSNNCALFGTTEFICQQCKPTFLLINKTCTKDYSGCLQYNSNSCTNCAFGTNLINGTCKGTLNCQQFDSYCKNCTQGYYLNSNRCFYIQRDCVKIDINSGACSICAPGLTLIGFSCVKSIENKTYCYILSKDGCLMCKIGFGLLNGKCILIPQCNSNQFVNATFQCQVYPLGCRTVSNISFNCTTCYHNYQLINDSCIPILPQHCSILATTGQCLNCSQRYYSSNFTCSPVSIFCGGYNSLGWCLNCSFPYFINRVGLCIDPYCLNTTKNSCSTCRQYYTLDNATNRCIINDPHCTNASDVNCNSCISGYYPSNDICLPLPPNCINADRKGNCLLCQPNHYLQLDQCYPTNQTLNQCYLYYQYSYLPQCIQCETGYFVALAKCIQIPPFCSLLLSNGQCAVCLPNFVLNNAQCVPLNNNPNPNCATLINNTCLRCNSGYLLGVNNICYSFFNKGCISTDSAGVCLQCASGSIPTRGGCIVGSFVDINCKTYKNNVCSQCYQGYFLANNRCKLPNSDCNTFSPSNGGCLSCYPGYTLTNIQCIVVGNIPNCQSYDARANCIDCSSFYYLSNNTCQKVNPLCSAYNRYTGSCTFCYPGFSIINGTCVQKTQPVWINTINNSQTAIETCLTYNRSTGICAQCISGYYLQETKCLSYTNLPGVDPNCKSFQNISFCNECYPGYSPISGSCSSIDPLCKTYNSTNANCSSCYQGYNLNHGKCSINNGQQINTCLVLNGSKCLKCIDNFKLVNSDCIFNGTSISNFNIPYCQIANNQTDCALCSAGFYSLKGVCYQVSLYCNNYNPETGACLTCKQSYVFVNGSCVYPAMGIDKKCQRYVGVYCAQCVSGFFLKNYICQLIDPKCTNFNFQINQCIECSSGTPLFDLCQ